MSEPTTQEIRERDKRTGSCTYCWTHNDGLDAAADRSILLERLDAAEGKLAEIEEHVEVETCGKWCGKHFGKPQEEMGWCLKHTLLAIIHREKGE